jgi:hypothetical protein
VSKLRNIPQDAALLNDPNITWAAETETLFHFSNNDNETLKRGYQYKRERPKLITSTLQTLKSDFTDLPVQSSSRILEYELGRLIQNKETQFLDFKKRRISWDSMQELVLIDKSGIKLNPTNLKGTFIHETGYFVPTKPSFIIRQFWYYHERKKELTSKVVAISPIIPFPIVMNDDCTEQIYDDEIFARFGWINMPQSATFDSNINRKDLIWSRLSTHNFDFKKSKILKGNTDEMLYQIFYQEPITNNRAVYPIENFNKNSLPLTNFEIKELVEARIDTLITFDSETYKEVLNIKKSPETKRGEISKFQIVQQWY